ncbi:MAG: SIR2 family NAD-dependent protein deacylase [Candidatus Hodarchaeales archaeon]|jgi:NAD-dependent SIR2 family protein deacetylase
MSFSQQEITRIAQIIADAKYLVAFTGAGISTESGLSDYRGPDGVWTRRDKGLPPKRSTKPLSEISPNPGHQALFDLYELGILKYLISQNVDNLHRRSGIPPEILAELHGNHALLKCIECDTRFTKEELGWNNQVHGTGYRTDSPSSSQPNCPNCGARMISSVVNFSDPMPEREMSEANKHSARCDVMLVVGSTLSVYPAADLPQRAKEAGAQVIIINMGPTHQVQLADMRIEAKAGEFLPKVVEEVQKSVQGLSRVFPASP